jgi:hypothetical protein
MKALISLFLALAAVVQAQQPDQPLASFEGTVHEINSINLRLARASQDDLDISLTHKTRYFSGEKKIKRDSLKPGDRISVETKLDLYLKPEAVNVRLLPPPEKLQP